jgi:hypothetical protein
MRRGDVPQRRAILIRRVSELMSRISALWSAAALAVIVVLLLGAVVLRPALSASTQANEIAQIDVTGSGFNLIGEGDYEWDDDDYYDDHDDDDDDEDHDRDGDDDEDDDDDD